MTILTVSNLNNAKDKLSQFVAGDRKLIGVGIVLPDSKAKQVMKIAVIDVTEEVTQGHLDTTDPHLVNAFIHSHQEEIHEKVKETLVPALIRVVSVC